VIERADGLCEGCRSAEAVHVHHLTYKHCGNEFLWELVAICRECHERVHGREFED
jgi:5-methylcytosine-specific restriction endonuclease McrA